MTWVEALPCTAIIAGLVFAAIQSRLIEKKLEYRGIFDRRIGWGEFMDYGSPDMRLAERDARLGLYPTNAEWVHPVWRPENYPEQQ